MAAIMLKDVSDDLHRRLKERAEQNRRSMKQEIVLILEQAVMPLPPLKPVKPIVPKRPFTNAWLLRAIREGRE